MKLKEVANLQETSRHYDDAKFKVIRDEMYLNAMDIQIEAIDTLLGLSDLSTLEGARLLVERIELDYKRYNKSLVLIEYKRRCAEYEPEYERRLSECNDNFDKLWVQAGDMRNSISGLGDSMIKYLAAPYDEKLKVEFYFMLKYHVDLFTSQK